jgi:hypothetical protein
MFAFILGLLVGAFVVFYFTNRQKAQSLVQTVEDDTVAVVKDVEAKVSGKDNTTTTNG